MPHGIADGFTDHRLRVIGKRSVDDRERTAVLRTSAQYSGPLSVIDAALADHAEAVVREAVSNAVRHAKATTLTVNVAVGDDLCIEVIDNGKGIADDVTPVG